MQVWKFPLSLTAQQKIEMPLDAKPLFVAVQESREATSGGIHHVKTLTMWMEVDERLQFEKRTFSVVGTGHQVPPNSTYIGSDQMDELVWHVYEEEAMESIA